mgnify:FL=1
MWVYRYGEISHSLAASEGPIHVIQGLYVNWREPIFSLPRCKSEVCLDNERSMTKEI